MRKTLLDGTIIQVIIQADDRFSVRIKEPKLDIYSCIVGSEAWDKVPEKYRVIIYNMMSSMLLRFHKQVFGLFGCEDIMSVNPLDKLLLIKVPIKYQPSAMYKAFASMKSDPKWVSNGIEMMIMYDDTINSVDIKAILFEHLMDDDRTKLIADIKSVNDKMTKLIDRFSSQSQSSVQDQFKKDQ